MPRTGTNMRAREDNRKGTRSTDLDVPYLNLGGAIGEATRSMAWYWSYFGLQIHPMVQFEFSGERDRRSQCRRWEKFRSPETGTSFRQTAAWRQGRRRRRRRKGRRWGGGEREGKGRIIVRSIYFSTQMGIGKKTALGALSFLFSVLVPNINIYYVWSSNRFLQFISVLVWNFN